MARPGNPLTPDAEAVDVGFLLTICMSTFIERSSELRVDMLGEAREIPFPERTVMEGYIILGVIAVQPSIIGIVVFLLNKKLDQELFEAALEQLEAYTPQQTMNSLTVRFALP